MIRRHLLACAAAAALVTTPAAAQWIVNDPSHQMQNMLSWAQQAADMVRQYQQLQAQYRQMVSQYEATARAIGSGNVAGAMGGITRRYSPGAADMLSMAQGNMTWGRAAGFLERSRRYMPTERDAWARDMEQRERTTANFQALAYEGLADADEQLDLLAVFQNLVGGTNTVVDAGVVNAQMAGFRQNLELNKAKLEQARMMLAVQERIEMQQGEQAIRESADRLRERTQGAVDSLGAGSGGAMTLGPGGW